MFAAHDATTTGRTNRAFFLLWLSLQQPQSPNTLFLLIFIVLTALSLTPRTSSTPLSHENEAIEVDKDEARHVVADDITLNRDAGLPSVDRRPIAIIRSPFSFRAISTAGKVPPPGRCVLRFRGVELHRSGAPVPLRERVTPRNVAMVVSESFGRRREVCERFVIQVFFSRK